MILEDKTIRCESCGEEFVFTVGEQEFYAEKGLGNEPRRCKPCRVARKKERRLKSKERHKIVCDCCGKEAEVPFEPTQGLPVYCDECFRAQRK